MMFFRFLIIAAIAFLLILFRIKAGIHLWQADRVDIVPNYPGGRLWCGTVIAIVGLVALGWA